MSEKMIYQDLRMNFNAFQAAKQLYGTSIRFKNVRAYKHCHSSDRSRLQFACR